MNATLDYETRSRCNLKDCGSFRYACDPSTEILMASVSADDDPRVYLWVNPKFRIPDNAFENREAESIIMRANLIYAHNVPFEQAITQSAKFGPFQCPPLLDQWRCTMAMARKAGLPQSLEQLGEALGIEQKKDTRGKALIKFFCEPRKDGLFNEPRDHPDKWMEFCGYCVQDNRAETEVGHRLKPFELTGAALETFQFDLRMNNRGIPVNVSALRHAQRIIESVQTDVTQEFQQLTKLNPTQREKVRELVNLPDMTAETIEHAIKDATGERKRLLQLYQKVSYAAVKKIGTMLDWACPDGRMRGVLKYYGAGTGRWSAGGPQIQNAKKATPEMRPITDAAYAAISKGCGAELLDQLYGDPLEVVSCCIRHFVHLPGSTMLDGDYNAIEGRIGCWLAGQEDILEAWRNGVDLYKRAAAFVYRVSEDSIGKDEKRDLGKVIELACQFGLGTDGFIRTCENFGIECSEELAERGVHEYYRPTHRKIVERWYYLDSQMKAAMARPGTLCGPFQVRRLAGIPYLMFRLRSGRSLAYPHPKIEIEEEVPAVIKRTFFEGGWKEEIVKAKIPRREVLTYWGQLFQSTQWGRVRLWGSKAFENEVQATAADVMAHGSLGAEKRGMAPFALIHDQGLAVKVGKATAADFAAALATLPDWAKGLPVKVEAKEVPYYSK